MTHERLIMAIGKLERALSKAETNADSLIKTIHSGSNQNSDQALIDFRALEQKHIKLKQHASEALIAIDSIVASKAGS